MTWFKKGLRHLSQLSNFDLAVPGSKMTWFKKGLRPLNDPDQILHVFFHLENDLI